MAKQAAARSMERSVGDSSAQPAMLAVRSVELLVEQQVLATLVQPTSHMQRLCLLYSKAAGLLIKLPCRLIVRGHVDVQVLDACRR